MSNAVQIFNSDQFGTIRTAGTPENPLFCLVDVCKALSLTPSKIVQRLSDGVLSKYPIQDNKGRVQNANFVNEDGLYDVILDSRKPEAKAFRKWVTSVVLPSIRKSGGYVVAAPAETPELVMARALKLADDTIRRQQADIEEQNTLIKQQDGLIAEQNDQLRRLIPLEGYVQSALESGTTYTMTEVAQFVGFARVADFLDWAVKAGILYRVNGRWMPTTDFLGKGYFATRVYRRMANAACIEENYYTVVTESGRLMFYQRMEEWTDPTPPKSIEAPRNADHFATIEEGGAL
ncbi:MAG: phage antirepressor KilAC domain-containing protein [Bacteroidales bacterium]|nr:phage antirepressor KilAC domain-containing protein [Bacteroidales bacterium]